MKRLIVTNLNISLEKQIKHPAFIALKSAQIKVPITFTLSESFNINIRPSGADRRDRFFTMDKGKYDIFKLVKMINNAQINVGIFEFSIDARTNQTKLKVKKGWEFNIAGSQTLYEILGIGVAKHAWLKEGQYFGNLTLGSDQHNQAGSLWLKCSNLDDRDNLLDGKKSTVFHVFPLNKNDVLNFHYENPVFLPLNSSTNTLQFELCDQVQAEVILELLIKDGKLRH